MNLKQIQYFLRVADLGSVTQASIALNVAQPTLSRNIRALEVELHHDLFNRTGRGVTTTEAGERLLSHCRGIAYQLERAEEDMARMPGSLAGRVALGIPPSPTKRLAVPLARECRKQIPESTISISEGLTTVLQRQLLAGELDIACLYNPSVSSGKLTLELMVSEQLCVIGRKDKIKSEAPVPLYDLADMPLIVPNRPHTVRALLESELAMLGRHPSVRLSIDSVPAILALVSDGVGLGVLTESAIMASRYAEYYSMRPIVQPILEYRLYLATAAARKITHTQKAALGIIRAVTRQAYANTTHAVAMNRPGSLGEPHL